MKRSPIAFAVVLALAAFAAPARGGDPYGPPFGSGRYEASIARNCSDPDADDYVAHLLKGEKVSVSLKVAKGSALMPRLTLVGPGGSEIAPAVAERSGGKSLALRGFVVPETGRWAVRVTGRDATEGAYAVEFGVARAADLRLRKLALAAQDDTRIDFEGVTGATLDVRVSWRPTDAPVSLGSIEDPSHRPVSGVTVSTGRTSFAVKGLTLMSGDGTYGLHLVRSGGSPVVNVSVRVTPQGRPANKKPIRLADAEPWLETRDAPIRGIAGGIVHMTGGNFSAVTPPAVFFGRERATAMVRSAGSIDVIPPPIAAGKTVDVAIVGADGQSCVRPGYFHYVEAPAIADLVDDGDRQVRLGRAAGGETLWLRGTNFASGQTVRFGLAPATVLTVTNPARMRVVVPPGTGNVTVYVEDAFGRSTPSGFKYTYKSAPQIAASPFSPAWGPVAGGLTITVTGTGFEPADRIILDGSAVATTFVDSTHLRFASPAMGAGICSFAVRDRFDAIAPGAGFEIRGAPTIQSAVATGGNLLDASHAAAVGGTVVTVIGTGLEATGTVTLGGTAGTVISATANALTFTTGAAPIGAADLVVTDSFGQSAVRVGAIRLVGWEDETAAESPGASALDDLTGWRGAVADFDGDGLADDLVVVSDDASPGTRSEFTRLFFRGAAGFADVTASSLPPALADPAGLDDWKALAVSAGDVNGDHLPDIVITGGRVTDELGGEFEARVFRNAGSGSFVYDKSGPRVRTEPWYCFDTTTGAQFKLFAPDASISGRATCAALGDLDGDGDADLVVGTDRPRAGTLHIPLADVTFSGGYSYSANAGANYSIYGTAVEAPALLVFENRVALGEDFRDATFMSLPRGAAMDATLPAFHARDLKLADIDGDGDLDVVLTWDDPTSVTAFGLTNAGQDSPRIATRVLINDGAGVFTDGTGTWMPAGSGFEYWQADRLALADLDSDGDLDMVLVHRAGTDAYAGTASHATPALRMLRNDGAAFVSVTSSAVPSAPLAGTLDDDLRGAALAVFDFDGDGLLDIAVGTTDALADGAGGAARSTRLLRGGAGLVFTDANVYLPPATSATGEANDIVIGDLSGTSEPSMILLTETPPARSPGGENLRVFGWNR